MGLAELQNALARLYTDSELRTRFLENSANVCSELGLKKEEAEQLSKISHNELSFFSDSLIWKRFGEVEKLLPLTKKALGENFRLEFQSFASAYNTTEIKKHLDDAINFCRYLEKKIETKWMVDVIRFERARLHFGAFNRILIVKLFDYDVVNTKTPKKKKWIGVWFRFSKTRKGKFFRFG